MKKFLLKLYLTISLVVSGLFHFNAEAGQKSGIIVEIADLPEFVSEAHLQILSTGKGKKIDMIVPVFNHMTVQLSLKPGTYALILHPVSFTGELSVPPSEPVLIEVEKKTYSDVLVAYTSGAL